MFDATKHRLFCRAGLALVAAAVACSSNPSSSSEGAAPVDAAIPADLAVPADLMVPADLVVSPDVEPGADSRTSAACRVAFSMSTANLEAVGVELAGTCTVDRFFQDGGYRIHWDITDTQGKAFRRLHVTQYPGYAEAGTIFRVEDFQGDRVERGVYVTYGESTLSGINVWVARKGRLELKSMSGRTYPRSGSIFALELTAVQFGPGGATPATGEFEVSGTISGTLP